MKCIITLEKRNIQHKYKIHTKVKGNTLKVKKWDTLDIIKVIKKAKFRNRYNQVPHLTQDTNGEVTNSQLDITNESQQVSPFQAGAHKATINRRSQKQNKHRTEMT